MVVTKPAAANQRLPRSFTPVHRFMIVWVWVVIAADSDLGCNDEPDGARVGAGFHGSAGGAGSRDGGVGVRRDAWPGGGPGRRPGHGPIPSRAELSGSCVWRGGRGGAARGGCGNAAA